MPTTPLAPGVWGVVATPFLQGGAELDLASLRRLVQRYEQIGATGLTVLGVFGEAAKLDRSERRQVLETVRDAVALPLVVGATTLATATVIDEVRDALDVVGDRLAGAMVQINTPDPQQLAAHITAVHRATGAGIVVQDYPVASGVNIALDAQVAALRSAEGVVAVKAEAAPTAVRVARLATEFDVPVFGGLGGIGLIDELAVGAAGAMTGFSYPEGLLETVHAYAADGLAGARRALSPYLPLINFEQQPAIALAIRKRCLVERGLLDDAAVRAPGSALPAALEAPLLEHLRLVEEERAR
jgi:4-hydroxy-tetrahydrodipicolinate synthase